METIRVDKAKLLEILRNNRQKHRQFFEEALDGYRKKAIELLEARLEEAKKGTRIQMFFQLVEPVDRTKDYDRAIGMLEMSIRENADLSERDYQQYVTDEWDRSLQFLAANSTYSGTAAALLAQARNETE